MLRQVMWIALLASLLPRAAGAADFAQTVPVEPGGSLELQLDVGHVEVESHDEPQVRIEAHTSGWGSVEFEVESDGSKVVVRGRHKGLLAGLGAARVRVSIRVPERFGLEIHTSGGSIEIEEIRGPVTAHTSGGSIALDSVEGPVELRTSGGSIEAEGIEGDLDARTSGGTIRVSEVKGRVEARTSGGSIEVLDVGGPVQVHTSGGSIAARFSGRPEGEIKTSGGTVEVEIPEGVAFDLDAQTSGGRIEIEEEFLLEGKLAPDRVQAAINGGGPKLELRTSGGDIRISVE